MVGEFNVEVAKGEFSILEFLLTSASRSMKLENWTYLEFWPCYILPVVDLEEDTWIKDLHVCFAIRAISLNVLWNFLQRLR